jgi:hypothetical protein
MTEQASVNPQSLSKKLLIYGLAALILNIILVVIEPTGSTTDLTNQVVSGWAIKRAMFVTLIVGFSVISAVLALLIALVPYKTLTWGQKYLPSMLLAYLLLQLLFLFFEVKFLLVSL